MPLFDSEVAAHSFSLLPLYPLAPYRADLPAATAESYRRGRAVLDCDTANQTIGMIGAN
jgi:hypothetical protein